ncbi:MAG: hypothetical protein WD226_14200 [Planctomycetota bacterium]
MLAALACLALLLAPAPAPGPASDPDSLQEFLRRVRAERARVLDSMRADVEAAIAAMEEVESLGSDEQVARAAARMRALGPAARPLLVPYLDGKTDHARRADEVEATLRELGVGTVLEELLELARGSSLPTRVRAIRLLADAPPEPRIDAFLEDQATTATGALQAAAMGAVVRRGSGAADQVIDRALGEGLAPDEIFVALEGAAPTRIDLVLRRAFANTKYIAKWLEPALQRLRELPQPLSSELYDGLAGVIADETQETPVRLGILGTLERLEPAKDKRLLEALTGVSQSPDETLRKGALVCLALTGDRSAKSTLMAEYDELIAANRNWVAAWEQRADMLLRIRDYREAAKDYQVAIDLDESSRRGVPPERRVQQARALAGDGKLKAAHDALQEAGLNRSKRAKLATEPIFAALVAHSRYGKLLRD